MKSAVITCFFNWCGFAAPQRNLRRFLRLMARDNVPVFGVEAVVSGQLSITGNIPGWRSVIVDPDQRLFIKEALLNLAVEDVPEEYRGLIWLDADVWFEDPHWFPRTRALLNAAGVVQPFDAAYWTDATGDVVQTRPAVLARLPEKYNLLHTGHTGFGMGFRRDIWEEVGGLYPWCVTGAGDACAAAAVLGLEHEIGLRVPAEMVGDYNAWRARMRTAVLKHGGVAAVPGKVIHEFHGEKKNRQYGERHSLMALATNPTMKSGVPSAGDALADAVMEYFQNREEDNDGDE